MGGQCGKAFVAHLGLFLQFIIIAWILGLTYHNREDEASTFQSPPTFILNAFNHGSMSATGKAYHYLYSLAEVAVLGVTESNTLWATALKQGFSTLGFGFMLGYIMPRFVQKTKSEQNAYALITNTCVYAWAFSFINDMWWVFFTYLGSKVGVEEAQVWFWGLVDSWLLAAVLLGRYCGQNFYGGPDYISATFGSMLCWAVDFGVWWGWGQIMVYIDAASTHPILFNVLLVLGLLVLTSCFYSITDVSILMKHHVHRRQHTVAKHVMNPDGSVDRESSDGDEE